MSEENKTPLSPAQTKLDAKSEGVTELYQLCEYLAERDGITSFTLEDIEQHADALLQTYKEQNDELIKNQITTKN